MHALDGISLGTGRMRRWKQQTLRQTHPVAESKEEPAEKNPQK